MPPLGGLERQPRGFGVALVVLATVPALWYAWAIYSDFALGTRYLGSDPIKEAEHAYGAWTLRLLLASLAITPMRRISGWNWLAKHRRTLGLYAFAYGVLHLSVWAILDVQLIIDDLVGWDVVWTDLTKRPFITIGMLCLLLMLPLAITSTKGMIKRLGKRWTKLHRLVYVIAILGIVHFFMAVKLDIREPGVYALILAALLGWRVRDWRRRGSAAAA
jgi:methionine sulfoxide reductase heme-binding subunit